MSHRDGTLLRATFSSEALPSQAPRFAGSQSTYADVTRASQRHWAAAGERQGAAASTLSPTAAHHSNHRSSLSRVSTSLAAAEPVGPSTPTAAAVIDDPKQPFEERLLAKALPEWTLYFVNYRALKGSLNAASPAFAAARTDKASSIRWLVNPLFRHLTREVKKVSTFYDHKKAWCFRHYRKLRGIVSEHTIHAGDEPGAEDGDAGSTAGSGGGGGDGISAGGGGSRDGGDEGESGVEEVKTPRRHRAGLASKAVRAGSVTSVSPSRDDGPSDVEASAASPPPLSATPPLKQQGGEVEGSDMGGSDDSDEDSEDSEDSDDDDDEGSDHEDADGAVAATADGSSTDPQHHMLGELEAFMSPSLAFAAAADRGDGAAAAARRNSRVPLPASPIVQGGATSGVAGAGAGAGAGGGAGAGAGAGAGSGGGDSRPPKRYSYIVIKKALADFHRELVFLQQYLVVNERSIVKFLNKLDKRTAGGGWRDMYMDIHAEELEFLSDDSLQGIIDATSRMIEELSQAVRKLRSDEWYNTKVYTVGCYDLFHRGHENLFKALRDFGRFIVAGIHDDASYLALKGKAPIDNLEKRMRNVMPHVDMLFVIPSTDPTFFLQAAVSSQDVTTQNVCFVRGEDMLGFPGRDWVETVMPVHFLPRSLGVSSTLVRSELGMAQPAPGSGPAVQRLVSQASTPRGSPSDDTPPPPPMARTLSMPSFIHAAGLANSTALPVRATHGVAPSQQRMPTLATHREHHTASYTATTTTASAADSRGGYHGYQPSLHFRRTEAGSVTTAYSSNSSSAASAAAVTTTTSTTSSAVTEAATAAAVAAMMTTPPPPPAPPIRRVVSEDRRVAQRLLHHAQRAGLSASGAVSAAPDSGRGRQVVTAAPRPAHRRQRPKSASRARRSHPTIVSVLPPRSPPERSTGPGDQSAIPSHVAAGYVMPKHSPVTSHADVMQRFREHRGTPHVSVEAQRVAGAAAAAAAAARRRALVRTSSGGGGSDGGGAAQFADYVQTAPGVYGRLSPQTRRGTPARSRSQRLSQASSDEYDGDDAHARSQVLPRSRSGEYDHHGVGSGGGGGGGVVAESGSGQYDDAAAASSGSIAGEGDAGSGGGGGGGGAALAQTAAMVRSRSTPAGLYKLQP